MRKSKDTSADKFERLVQTPPPADPRDFENLKANTQALPQVGYVREFQNTEQRGREIMDAARRGERNFPPARQVVK